MARVVLDLRQANQAGAKGNDKNEDEKGRKSPNSILDPGSGPSPLPSPAPSMTVVDPASLPHGPVSRVDEMFFETRDGCRLSARLWLPAGVRVADAAAKATDLTVPAVVEVLPYGVHHSTVDADEATWPYLAGHGIACVRVDSRGSGNSSGVLDDEYSAQQQRDACDAVEWAARQSWCTGSVGLMGCSWGGFIALQAAALAGRTAAEKTAAEAPSLKAVCAVCATDDRASDDMHWMGGALLGENLAWGAWLLDSLAQPPVSVADVTTQNKTAEGEERWVERLSALKPLHSEWASKHPTRGGAQAAEYWAEGSVGRGDGESTIAVPVLSVGGFNGGGYANSTPRLARSLGADQVTAVMGGWVHNYPHLSQAGPSFGFLAEALAFWQKHLYPRADTATAAAPVRADPPGVRIHVPRPPPTGAPITAPERAEGYWVVQESQRRLDEATETAAMTFDLTFDGVLAPAAAAAAAAAPSRAETPFRCFQDGGAVPLTDDPSDPVGVASGRWFTFGDGDDLPGDQKPDDDKSACFDAAPAAVETPVVGAPRVTVAVTSATADAVAEGVLVVRICAVSPSGVSHRVTYGVADVKQQTRERQLIEVKCNYCAFSLPAGWRLRVAVSQTYWPVVTPHPRAAFAPFAVVGGKAVVPALPSAAAAVTNAAAAAADVVAPPLEVVASARANRAVLRRGAGVRYERTPRAESRSVDLGARRLDVQHLSVEGSSVDRSEIVGGGGAVSHQQHVERHSVIHGAFLSASNGKEGKTSRHRAAETRVKADMKVLDGEYHFTTSLEAFVLEDEGNGGGDAARRSVFSQSWTKIVPVPPAKI